MQNVVIVGGGAAGLMAAATIFETDSDSRVFLIEKNSVLGRKVLISGGGRCNVTTGLNLISEVLKKYPRGGKFLKTAMYNFSPDELFEWIENHGVALKVEDDFRVFPKSNNGKDIVDLFEKMLLRAEILFKTSVKGISKHLNKFIVHLSTGRDIEADKVILTTGGQAYSQTGSEGDGYLIAKSLGHTITELAPSLNSFLVEENWVKDLAGVSFKSVKLRVTNHEFCGPILFTHKGITGPAVFALSSLAAYEIIDKDNTKKLLIDFFPDKSYETLLKEITDGLNLNPKQSFHKALSVFVVKSMAKTICSQIGIPMGKQNMEISKKELNKSVEALKNTQITLIGKSPGEEFVTAGGVNLSEVDSKTMESKICPGLYFAGEILDIDGFTGGFNLQAAWATGRLAGKNCAENF